MHIESLIKNLAHLLEIISKILELKECHEHKENLIKVLINLGNPSYIAELLNISNVFFHVSLLEKKAQSETFGIFDYFNVTNEFINTINNKLKRPDHRLID